MVFARGTSVLDAFLAALLLIAMACGPVWAASDEPLPVEEIAPGVFVYRATYELATPDNLGMIGNCGFIVGRDGVAVIDTGSSFRGGRRLLAAIRRMTPKSIRFVIDTHVHPDHLLGNAAFAGEGAVLLSAETLPEALGARADIYLRATESLIGADAFAGTRIVAPTETVSAPRRIDLGDRTLLVEAWPTAHTNSDLTVLDETTGSWFLGDLVFVGHVPALDGSLKGWLDVLGRLEARPARRVVPGHGPASLVWPDGAADTRRYLQRLRDDIRAMIGQGKPMSSADAAAATEAGRWSLFDAFNARNGTAAYHELEWE
jgi:quinoprotein relay system zinc metallohydrolase 2